MQDVDFGFGEVVSFIFDVDRGDEVCIVDVRGDSEFAWTWTKTPKGPAYVCACDLEKFRSVREEEGERVPLSVGEWGA